MDYTNATITMFDPLNAFRHGGVARTTPYVHEKESDAFSFMETFSYPKIDELEKSLMATGEYNAEAIKEIISGLKTLPEYRD